MSSYYGMCFGSCDDAFVLPEVRQNDVIFDNFFAQGQSTLSFLHEDDQFELFLKHDAYKFSECIVLCLKCDGNDVELVLPGTTRLEHLDDRFEDIDLNLLQGDIRQQLVMCLFEKYLGSLQQMLSMPVEIVSMRFDGDVNNVFERECGVEIKRGEEIVSLINVRCSDAFFQRIIPLCSKCSQDSVVVDCELPFSWYIQLGSTQLLQEDYKGLEEQDIVFLDDSSCIDNNCYKLSGIDGMVIDCTFTDGSLVVNKVVV